MTREEFLRLRKFASLATVDGVVVKDRKILLTKRNIEPFKNYWVLPGGHIEIGETAESAVIREVSEECGLKTEITDYLNVYSTPGRDPRGHTVSNVFMMKIVGGALRTTEEVSESRFFGEREVPENIGFDHIDTINDAFRFMNNDKKKIFRVVQTKKATWIPEKDFKKIMSNFAVCGANAVVIEKEKFLLVRRSIEPYKGYWCLPGGFVDVNETAEACALREIYEECGLKTEIIDNLGVYLDNNPLCHIIVNTYLLRRVSGTLKTDKENSELSFFSFNELPENLGFSHKKIINDAFKMLKIKK